MGQEEPADLIFTESTFRFFVEEAARAFSFTRKVKKYLNDESFLEKLHSSPHEMDADWCQACAYLGSKILQGEIDLALQVEPEIYWHLENLWLMEVKKSFAYLNWLKRLRVQESGDDYTDYLRACQHLRDMFINKDLKAPKEGFLKARSYIEKQYLSEGKIDTNKPATEQLIRKKANRIWQTTGRTDEEGNWQEAQTYIKLFYENIIPAINENNSENIFNILRAFQLSEGSENQFLVVNLFEAALAINFIDSSMIESIWNDDQSRRSAFHF